MNLQRLSIHQTYGQIGIQTHNASVDIHSPRGELTIERPQHGWIFIRNRVNCR
ncbi:hypothetical protein LJK88_00630 [Paenibacillus sp. P26]|nr:hypothetical protein LJK88_00630 [Paenibacillus sp. P26]UUZ91217.1 hypothetical protein LJK87_36795 [Paenibacillus sp. P25]